MTNQLCIRALQEPVASVDAGEPIDGDRFGAMVGTTPAMRAVFEQLARLAPLDTTVLLTGETGTGKEAAAEMLHRASHRTGPFIVIDCGAIPPDLLEGELFGHDRGAFTGAVGTRAGAFELAQRGTIFLDELGELTPSLQPKLLRVLEKREVKRLGSAWRPIDVRIVAATNRDLTVEVAAGRFRRDLFYRIAVVEVRLPALRERRDDLPLLVDELVARMGKAHRPEVELLRSSAVRAELAQHDWPGNVRELRNYVERCLAFGAHFPLERAAAAPVELEAEPESGSGSLPSDDLRAARKQWTGSFEKTFLAQLLARHAGNVSAAARAAGYDRKHFYRLLWRHGLR